MFHSNAKAALSCGEETRRTTKLIINKLEICLNLSLPTIGLKWCDKSLLRSLWTELKSNIESRREQQIEKYHHRLKNLLMTGVEKENPKSETFDKTWIRLKGSHGFHFRSWRCIFFKLILLQGAPSLIMWYKILWEFTAARVILTTYPIGCSWCIHK